MNFEVISKCVVCGSYDPGEYTDIGFVCMHCQEEVKKAESESPKKNKEGK